MILPWRVRRMVLGVQNLIEFLKTHVRKSRFQYDFGQASAPQGPEGPKSYDILNIEMQMLKNWLSGHGSSSSSFWNGLQDFMTSIFESQCDIRISG